jgi:hypothetical protein
MRGSLKDTPGLRPLDTVTLVDELMEIAEDGGNLRERWNYRLANLLDRPTVISTTVVGQALSQLPHLGNLLVNGHYGGGWPVSALQIGGIVAGYGLTFLAVQSSKDYRAEFEYRKERALGVLTRNHSQPQLSPLEDADPLPADPTERWIAVHRQAIEAGAKIDDAVKKANKIVYGDERGRYGKHAQPRPSF